MLKGSVLVLPMCHQQ